MAESVPDKGECNVGVLNYVVQNSGNHGRFTVGLKGLHPPQRMVDIGTAAFVELPGVGRRGYLDRAFESPGHAYILLRATAVPRSARPSLSTARLPWHTAAPPHIGQHLGGSAMRMHLRTSFFLVALLSVGFAIPASAATGGATAKPPASPKPDSQKKIWTNDDVERLNPEFVPGRAPESAANSVTAPPATGLQSARPAPSSVAALDPQQDPRWYAQQVTALDAELAAIDSHEEQLREFRTTSVGLPTGLVLNAPCEGITTDNLIAQLESRRQEIAQQIDALSDLARENSLPPGILVEGRGLELIPTQSSVEEQRAAATRLARDAPEQLAQVQGEVDGMQDQLSSQGITLARPAPGEGGNMTTDLLDRLDSRASALQSEISQAEDAAQGLGVPPGDLR